MESNIKKDDNRNSSYTCYSGIYANTCFCCKFHRVGLLTLLDTGFAHFRHDSAIHASMMALAAPSIDCGCCTVGTFEAPC